MHRASCSRFLSISTFLAAASLLTILSASHGTVGAIPIELEGEVALSQSGAHSADIPLDPDSTDQVGSLGGAEFGIAHIDIMDLHLGVDSEGKAVPNEILKPASLAERYALATQAGASFNRWSLYWNFIETEAGQFEWQVADGIVQRDLAAGLSSLLILQGTPVQYVDAGQEFDQYAGGHALDDDLHGVFSKSDQSSLDHRPEAFDSSTHSELADSTWAKSRRGLKSSTLSVPPTGMNQPIFLKADDAGTDDPGDAARINPQNPWARYVGEAVDRYRPGGVLAREASWPEGRGVRDWEVGNEPNLIHFWNGSAAEYARYLEIAYLVIHHLDPEARVAHGGIADVANAEAWFALFLKSLDDKSNTSPLPERYGFYFDASAWHWYSFPSRLQERPPKVRDALNVYGLGSKPIWVTELGIPIWSEHPGPCWDPQSPFRASVSEQADYVWQAFGEGLAQGVKRFIFFQLSDDCGNGPTSYDAFGLIRNHEENQCWIPPNQACWSLDPALAGSPRPAHTAFAAFADQLSEASLLWRPDPAPDGSQRILFYAPPDKRVMLYWNTTRSALDVSPFATGPEAKMLNVDGEGQLQTDILHPEDGLLSFRLDPMTNANHPGSPGGSILPGKPVMLVEEDRAAPFRARLEALPELSPTQFDLQIVGADGGTGVGRFQVFVAEEPPQALEDWQLFGVEQTWTGRSLTDVQTLRFEGRPGQAYYFNVRVADRAGNWTDLGLDPAVSTRIEGAPPSGTPSPPPSSVPATATVTLTPTATLTPTETRTSTETLPPTPDPTRPPNLSPGAFLPRLNSRSELP